MADSDATTPDAEPDDLEDSFEAELRAALRSDAPPAPVGVVVSSTLLERVVGGKYRILKQLGRGGMGQVFLAEHVQTRGHVALKVLRQLGNPQATKRFQIEAKNAAALQHPNTIRVTDYGLDEEMPFLVMEYLEGKDLSELLREHGPLEWRRAARIASQVLSALWAAHTNERRIVHRDIKPANILITHQPGFDDFVKVLDFGISRALDATGAGTEGIVGTPATVAPEQWVGRDLGPQSDLYSLGCTFYEMLTGRPAFTGRSVVEIGQAHVTAPLPALSTELAASVPPALDAWMRWLVEKEPEARPASASVALEVLKVILEHPEASPELVRTPEALRASCAPRPDARGHTTASLHPIRPSSPQRTDRTSLLIVIALLGLALIVIVVMLLTRGS